MSTYPVPSPYSPPMLDGTPSSSSSSLPRTPSEEQHGRASFALSLSHSASSSSSSSLPPSLGKLILNRSAPYNTSPPSSFGSSSSGSSSSVGSVASSGSSSAILAFGSSTAMARPPNSNAYTHPTYPAQQRSIPHLHSLGRDTIILPPLEHAARHLPPTSASARPSPPTVPTAPTPPSTRLPTSVSPEEALRIHAHLQSTGQLGDRRPGRPKPGQGESPLAFPSRPPPPNTYRPVSLPAGPSQGEDVFGGGAARPSSPTAGGSCGEYPVMSMVVRKRRRRTSPAELAILDAHFAANPLPTAVEREAIANEVNMLPRHIQIWFQNKRQTEKKRLFSDGYADRPPRSSSMTFDQTSSSSPAQFDKSGLPASSSPSVVLAELPKQDASCPRYGGGKENIPPVHRTASSLSSRSTGGSIAGGTPSGSGSDTGGSRSNSRADMRAEGAGPSVLVATRSGGIMDEVVGRRELPFVHGAPSTLVRGGKRPDGVDVWKNMMSDPPSGGLEEMIASDDDMDGADDDGELTDHGEGDVDSAPSRDRARPGQAAIPGIRSTLGASYTHSTPLHPSSLSRRLSTTSTASSSGSATDPTAHSRSTSVKIRTARAPASASVTASLTSSARHLSKTHSLASGLLSQGPNSQRRVPTHLAGERGPSMRRSASLDWAASRVASSPRAVSASTVGKARPSRLSTQSASLDVVGDVTRKANGAVMTSTPRPFKRVKTESDVRPSAGALERSVAESPLGPGGDLALVTPVAQAEKVAKKAGTAAEDEECAMLLLGLFSNSH